MGYWQDRKIWNKLYCFGEKSIDNRPKTKQEALDLLKERCNGNVIQMSTKRMNKIKILLNFKTKSKDGSFYRWFGDQRLHIMNGNLNEDGKKTWKWHIDNH